MNFNNTTSPPNSPQILPFPAENRPPALSIHTDDEDIRLLYVSYYPMVYRRCLAFLRNEESAKDMAGAVFEKIQELKTEGRLNVGYPTTYLSTMAKNMSINEIKKRDIERQKRKELIKIYDIATDEAINRILHNGEQGQKQLEAGIIDNCYEQVEAEIIVKAILDEQDEITRKIYIGKYYKDMTLEQIGEAVGLKKSAVHKRIKNLEQRVKAAWGRDGA